MAAIRTYIIDEVQAFQRKNCQLSDVSIGFTVFNNRPGSPFIETSILLWDGQCNIVGSKYMFIYFNDDYSAKIAELQEYIDNREQIKKSKDGNKENDSKVLG